GYLSNNIASKSVDLVAVQFPPKGPQFSSIQLIGTNLVCSGANGVVHWPYAVLASTNLLLPHSQWHPVATNVFDSSGNFIFINAINSSTNLQFLSLQFLQ